MDRAQILANGWRQGSLFSIEDSARLLREAQPPPYLPREIADGFRLIVASHSCDIVSERDDEPYVDVYPVVSLPAGVDPQQLSVRNARRLHVHLTVGGAEIACEIFAPSRFSISRTRLTELAADAGASLSEFYLKHFVAWLAARFRRTAFPDEFNERLEPAKKKIRKALNDAHRGLISLLIDLDPFDETPKTDGTAYELSLLGLMTHADYETPETHAKATTALMRTKGALDGCMLDGGAKAFKVNKPELRSAATLSVADYDTYYSFGFEDLSLRDDTDLPPQTPELI